MRVFVTGASGFIGSAVVRELIGAGHEVLGLARSDQSAEAIVAAGASAHRGSLEDLESLKSGAASADGVIHLAFSHDWSKLAQNCEDELRAIEAIGDAIEGSGRPVAVASGVALLSPGRLTTEDDRRNPTPEFPRMADTAADLLSARGLRAAGVRLAPTVHENADGGFTGYLVRIAREKGVSAYIGEGLNHWPAVNRQDAARLFRLALEKGEAGARYHAIDEEGVPLKEIAEAIGQGLNVPAVSLTFEEAREHFGWFAGFVATDILASSAKTRQQLGWNPTGLGLLEDLVQGTRAKR